MAYNHIIYSRMFLNVCVLMLIINKIIIIKNNKYLLNTINDNYEYLHRKLYEE